MKNELISVIVPIYNVECYLEMCINSILNQTYDHLEVILVDDGSTDNSGFICDQYHNIDPRIRVIHKENGGLSDARNAGIGIASGEYITTIDGDDFVEKDFIMDLYNLIKLGNYDISSINRVNFFENDSNGKKIFEEYYNNSPEPTRYNADEYVNNIIKDKLPHEAWAKLYNKNIFSNNKYTKGLKVYEDIEFLLRVLKDKRLKIICDTSKASYYYRRRNGSIMTDGYNEYWNKELMYYIDLLKDPYYKNNMKDIKELLGRKIIRNFKKICDLNIEYTEIRKIHKYCSMLNANYLKSKRGKLKFILIKYFPKLFYLYLTKRSIEEKRFCKNFEKFLNENKNHSNIALLFNGPVTGNLGDHAILFAEEFFLKKTGMNVFLISAKEMNYFFKNNLHNNINDKMSIYITGGGNMGTLWRNEQERINIVLNIFKKNKIVIFPQTIYYSDDSFGKECFNIDKKVIEDCIDLEIQCRDKDTYNFVKSNLNVKCMLTKDMALSLDYTSLKLKRNKILLCFRNDIEKIIDDGKKQEIVKKIEQQYPNQKIEYIDTVITKKKEYSYQVAKKQFRKIINKIASSTIVITDRLHCMIFCVITNTPCVAFNNKSGKIKGVYNTIKNDIDTVEFIE